MEEKQEKSRIDRQFDFIREIDKEKFITRQTFLSDAKAKFAERIAIFLLILEILITFFLLFFNSLKYILPPALIYLNTGQYEFFLFKNISIAAFLYTVLDVAILLTFNSSIETLKVFNRILLTYLFLINSILGIITLIS